MLSRPIPSSRPVLNHYLNGHSTRTLISGKGWGRRTLPHVANIYTTSPASASPPKNNNLQEKTLLSIAQHQPEIQLTPSRMASTVSAAAMRQAQSTQHGLIPPSQRILQPLTIRERTLLGPGPSNMTPEIRDALAAPLLGHLHPEFLEIMDDVKAGLRYAFQTDNSLTFAVSGTGHAGMECALLNLLEPGETLLVVENGVWGQRVADLANRLNLNVVLMRCTEGEVVRLEDFEREIKEHQPAVAFLCHGESSTGVLHPIEGFGEVCRKNGTLLLVDTVASLGGAPFFTDEWKVDCVYAATQKVLNAPPGLSPISFGPRALAKMRFRKTRVASFYFDALEIGNYWGCFNEPRKYHHTAPISLVYALRQALSIVAREGLDSMISRHQANAQHLYATLEGMGLELFVKDPAIRLPCLTTVKVPQGANWREIQLKLMAAGIEIAGGLGPTTGKIWRIGTFGVNSNPMTIAELGRALSTALDTNQPAFGDEEKALKAAI